MWPGALAVVGPAGACQLDFFCSGVRFCLLLSPCLCYVSFLCLFVCKGEGAFVGWGSFVDHLCCFCLVLLCFRARMFIGALWSPTGIELASWLSFVMSFFLKLSLSIGILGQV